jgi:multicomponent Na+:H+ antiporter subunit F
MLEQVLAFVLSVSLGTHVALVGVSVYRVWRGENLIDRLIGADLVTTLMLAILVLIAAIERNALYVDVALGLAALGFVGAIALAKYVADERMF